MTSFFLSLLSLLVITSTTVHSFQRNFFQTSVKSKSLSKHFYSNNEALPHLIVTASKNFRDYAIETELFWSSIQLSDTSISEEEVLEVSGQVTNLPDPLIAVAFAAVVFLGVAILQFSLGDLTKEV
jgi:hypothetical protein